MSRRTIISLLAGCGSAASALAGTMPVSLPGAQPGQATPLARDDSVGGFHNGYDPRGLQPVRGVMPNDDLSLHLEMTDVLGNVVQLDTGGANNVRRGPTFTDIGANRNGTSRMLATWDEVVANNKVYVIVLIRLTDTNDSFMPPNANINGTPALSWRWRVGSGINAGPHDPVNFQSFVTAVNMREAVVSFSNDLGASYTNGSTVFTSSLPPTWNPGVDNGIDIPVFGDGTNAMLLSYELDIVPAPASLGLLAAGGLVALRRRRGVGFQPALRT